MLGERDRLFLAGGVLAGGVGEGDRLLFGGDEDPRHRPLETTLTLEDTSPSWRLGGYNAGPE